MDRGKTTEGAEPGLSSEGRKFTLAELKAHIRQHHPNCPKDVRHTLYRLLRQRRWTCTVGKAVGITIRNYVRHEMTNYDLLFRLWQVNKAEARLIIRNEVDDIIASWGPDASRSTDPTRTSSG